nr:hypothetical protein [Paracoccus saliphilus]
MTRMTIRAADSAQAMEELMRCLGPEALILSTRQHRGQVEIEAMSGDTPLDVIAPRAPDKAPPDPSPRFAAELLRELTRRHRPDTVLPPHLPGRVVLVGPPGAGRSMLAARLAAEALRVPDARRPTLIAPRPDLLCPPGALAGWARILGLVPHRPVWPRGSIGALPAPAPDQTQILDLSDLPPQDAGMLAPLAAHPDAAIWLVLPTGLHRDYQDRLCRDWADGATLIALTRADLCPPTADDLNLDARFGLPVALIAQGRGLLDALSRPAMPEAADAVVPTHASDAGKPEEQADASAQLS